MDIEADTSGPLNGISDPWEGTVTASRVHFGERKAKVVFEVVCERGDIDTMAFYLNSDADITADIDSQHVYMYLYETECNKCED